MIQEPPRRFDRADPLAATYSILARDPATGEMGAAVQSHWFSVGTVVIWGEAGLGVVATQSFVNPSFGRRGLGLLRRGRSPAEAVEALISSDPGREVRQLAIMDRDGHAAVHTGARCIPAAGHMIGRDHSVQANMMGDDRVWPAMSEAFLSSEGHLAERMICAFFKESGAVVMNIVDGLRIIRIFIMTCPQIAVYHVMKYAEYITEHQFRLP